MPRTVVIPIAELSQCRIDITVPVVEHGTRSVIQFYFLDGTSHVHFADSNGDTAEEFWSFVDAHNLKLLEVARNEPRKYLALLGCLYPLGANLTQQIKCDLARCTDHGRESWEPYLENESFFYHSFSRRDSEVTIYQWQFDVSKRELRKSVLTTLVSTWD